LQDWKPRLERSGRLSVEPFVKLLVEKRLDSSSGTIRYANLSAPTIVNNFREDQSNDDVYGRIEGGVSFELGKAISLQLQGSATVENPAGNEFSGMAGVKLSF
jgi:hypothetical protein